MKGSLVGSQAVGTVVMVTALLAGGPVEATAQDGAVVRGTVRAEEGSVPLSQVMVELVELERRTLTDDLGRFRFRDIPAGTYTLRFELVGRSVVDRTIQVAGGVEVRDVELGAAPVALDPLLVLADRTRLSEGTRVDDVPGTVHVVSGAALEERPVLYDDVHALLRQVPGVSIQEEDGYGLRPNIGLRGTGSERTSKVTLMEDGVLIAPAPYAAPAAYYFPLAGRMEAIEVRKGSSQVRYGPFTIGGALNLVSTGIPSTATLRADAAAGSNGTRRLEVRAGNRGEHVGWLLETYRLESDGFKQLDGGGSTGLDLEDYVGKLRWNTDRDAPVYHELELKVGYYDERSDETYLGLTPADFAASPYRRYAASQEDRMRADHQQVQLRHGLHLPSGLNLVTTAYRNTFARNWYKVGRVLGSSISAVLSDPSSHAAELAVLRGGDSEDDALSVRANNREYYSQGIQAALGYELEAFGRHDLELGARYHRDEEDRFQHEDGYAMRDGVMVLTSTGAPGTQANRVSEATARSFYVQDRIRWGDLTVTPGIRYESIDFVRRDFAPGDADRVEPAGERENSVSAWIPGLGALYTVSPALRVFAGVHRGFGPPGPGADGETEPESSVSYELGLRLYGTGLRTQAAVFYSDYDNILGAETLSSGGRGTGDLHNGGAVTVGGFEIEASYDPLADSDLDWRLPLQVSYTWTSARFETSFESDFGPWGTVEAGDELPYLPRHQIFGRLGVERGAWTGTVTATATSAARTRAGQGPVEP
ncbi:MAG: TonB-dependent receptor domain-containing protein, partial [Gemmatimonadota bacterium]